MEFLQIEYPSASQSIPGYCRLTDHPWSSSAHDPVIPCLRYPLGSAGLVQGTSSHPQSPPSCGFLISPVPQLTIALCGRKESAWHEVVLQFDASLSACDWIHLYDIKNLSHVCAPLGHNNALARNRRSKSEQPRLCMLQNTAKSCWNFAGGNAVATIPQYCLCSHGLFTTW